MTTCTEPIYIRIASIILVSIATIVVMIGLLALGYYSAYGWDAARKDKKKVK